MRRIVTGRAAGAGASFDFAQDKAFLEWSKEGLVLSASVSEQSKDAPTPAAIS
ncbi:hypothetical protein STAQ_12430 [Allostella sp. ATCC 35155]|nr:hypothetical protein STAQ_12430 [Stella sp. ATCC 35155]